MSTTLRFVGIGSPVGGVVVEKVVDGRGLDAFLRVPYLVHADDPTWVPPLLAMEKSRLTPKKGPFFRMGEAQLFVAMRNGLPIGRVTAHINRNHLATQKDGAGHFGFFDCVDDQGAAHALVEAAAAWLRERGVARMVGPFNFSINEECGLQIEGFDTPPAVFMTQSRPWMAALLENEGFSREMDLLAYRVDPNNIGPRMRRLTQRARLTSRIAVRSPDMSRRNEELSLLVDIFNDSWSRNWGFSPLSEAEVESLLGGFSRFIRGHFARFVMLDGEPVGFMGFLPNYNEAIQTFGGKLLPFNWARLLYRLVADRFSSGRVVILGIRKAVQDTPLAGAITAVLLDETRLEAGKKYKWVEMGWVLETNTPMIKICEWSAGPPAKRYRIYGRAL